MLSELKERLLGDDRTVGAVSEVKNLYEAAEDPEAFHAALAEGDIESAAEYHPLSVDELNARIERLMAVGDALAEDHPDITDSDKEDFINA